jgi:hypothetical protein
VLAADGDRLDGAGLDGDGLDDGDGDGLDDDGAVEDGDGDGVVLLGLGPTLGELGAGLGPVRW